MDSSPPGSSVYGILQARILEWVAMPFSRGSSQPRDWTQVSCIAGRLPFDLPGSRLRWGVAQDRTKSGVGRSPRKSSERAPGLRLRTLNFILSSGEPWKDWRSQTSILGSSLRCRTWRCKMSVADRLGNLAERSSDVMRWLLSLFTLWRGASGSSERRRDSFTSHESQTLNWIQIWCIGLDLWFPWSHETWHVFESLRWNGRIAFSSATENAETFILAKKGYQF